MIDGLLDKICSQRLKIYRENTYGKDIAAITRGEGKKKKSLHKH